MDLIAGAPVTANIQLVQRLGVGGMGEVWIADHAGLKIRVAVKFVLQDDPIARARFAREAALAARIQSPHAVQVFDHGETDDGTLYIVMELLEGESLDERLARGPMTWTEALPIVQQVAQVLSAAHAIGVVHRDIKPSNIFLTYPPQGVLAKVLDFGLAKQVLVAPGDNVTATGALVGSPRFLSPELLSDASRADHRADLWALAAVVYEMLTGQPAFDGDTLGSILVSVVGIEYRPASAVAAGLPPALDAWFARAFHKDIAQRFQSAEELAAALSSVGHGGAYTGVAAPPPTAAQRKPWLWVAGVVGVLALVGMAVLIAFQLGASSGSEPQAKKSDSLNRQKAKKKKKSKSRDATWTPGSGSPHAGAEKCPFERCQPFNAKSASRFEPVDGVKTATKFMSAWSENAELTTVTVAESRNGLVNLKKGGGAQYHYRIAGGTATVHVTHGAMMLAKDKGMPALFGSVSPPTCRAAEAHKHAVEAGLASHKVVSLTYLQLPSFPGKPARSVWQIYAMDEPMRMWRMDGQSCKLIERM